MNNNTNPLKKIAVRRSLLVLAVFGLLMSAASCTTNEFTGPDHEIGLVCSTGAATKATSNGPVSGTTFPTGRTILLSAYYNDPNGTNHSQVHFTDIPFTYYSSKWAGGTSGTPNPKYWPHQGTMDFIALSKEGLAGTVTTTPSSQIVYVMPDNSTVQDDVMMARASGQNCATHSSVPLSFKHAQAQVAVKVKLAAAAYSSNYGITIRSITLRKARYSGTVTGTGSGSTVTFSWANVASGTQANIAFGTSTLALTTSEQVYGKGIVLPAQSPTGASGNIDILIEYTLKNGLPAGGGAAEERQLSYVYTVPSTNWTAGNKYTYVFSFSWNEITCTPTVSEWGDGGTIYEPDPSNGHAYVEIGGIKWATMNVGAASVTDAGLYFQWGDSQGYTASQVGSGTGQKNFLWPDYKYNDGATWPTSSNITKYNNTDGKTVLDLSDDGVRAAWGGKWRMPTKEELLALRDASNSVWTTNYQGTGVNGLICTDKNDSSKKLFFPAAGYAANGYTCEVNSEGYIWTSSIKTDYKIYAQFLDFCNSGIWWTDGTSRHLGAQLRGVLDD